jgi:hypothetical protein
MTTIAVCGSIAQRPRRPGHAWVFLSWLLGLRALGYEVLFIDRLDPGCVGKRYSPAGAARSREGRWLQATMSAAGLDGRYGALLAEGRTLGLSRAQLRKRLRGSALLLNVNGFLEDEELLAAAPRRVYLDIDPGFAQIWEAQGLSHRLKGHEDFVTVGSNVGAADCLVPTGGRRWIATLPPVLLDRWPRVESGEAFTSIGSWRGPFGPLEHAGVTYGLRAHELRRFITLPSRVGTPFRLALDIDPEDRRDRDALQANSWEILDPMRSLGSCEAYRRFIQDSMAEISIAKGVYVGTRGGWFSDRSACYLASGKPVLSQRTGVEAALPSGSGLICFGELEEAVDVAQELLGNLPRHRAAARQIAEEHLDSRVVLGGLLRRLGL